MKLNTYLNPGSKLSMSGAATPLHYTLLCRAQEQIELHLHADCFQKNLNCLHGLLEAMAADYPKKILIFLRFHWGKKKYFSVVRWCLFYGWSFMFLFSSGFFTFLFFASSFVLLLFACASCFCFSLVPLCFRFSLLP
jgi:hypothetical protein